MEQVIPDDLKKEISDCLGTSDWILEKDNLGGKYGPATKFKLKSPKTIFCGNVGSFEMGMFPGCCGICIAYYTRTTSNTLNPIFTRLQMWLAKQWNYKTLIYAATEDQPAQRKSLLDHGWKDILSFRNNSSKRIVHLSVVEFDQ